MRTRAWSLKKPDVENEQAELILRKGLEHEHAYLASLRGEALHE